MRIIVHVCNSYALEKSVYAAPDGKGREEIQAIRLPHNIFRLASDPVISLSISSQGVYLNERLSNVYIININGSASCEGMVSEDTEFRLITAEKEELKMFVYFGQEPMRFYRTTSDHVITMGSRLNNTISCPETEGISDTHLMLKPAADECRLNVKGKEGCYLNDRYLGQMGSAPVCYGDVITAGPMKLLWLGSNLGLEQLGSRQNRNGRKRLCIIRLEQAEQLPEARGNIKESEFNPVPRNIIYTDDEDIELDPPPPRREIRKQPAILTVGPALTMAIPMSLGCGMYIFASVRTGQQGTSAYMYTGLITAVASALIGSMWAIINLRNSQRNAAEEEALRISSYRDYIDRSNKMILDRYRYNANALLRNDLSVREIFTGSILSHLWNRIEESPDVFSYRLGRGRQPFRAQIKVQKEKFMTVPDELARLPQMLKRKYSELHDVPVCVDLAQNRLLGFIGVETEDITQLFTNISLQIAGVTEPYLIRMIFLFSNHIIPDKTVEYMHWLPQAQGEDEHYVSTDNERTDEILCGIDRIMKLPENTGARFVILTDDFRRLPAALLSNDKVSICIFAHDYSDLPGGCARVVENNPSFRGLLYMDAEHLRKEIRFDCIQDEEVNKYVRTLAGLRYTRGSRHSPIPIKVTLPELFKTDFFSVQMILENWKKNDTQNSLRAPVGMAEDGRVIFLDLHEKAHGPHGLIAGMTGSGKSEMLQTIILSLSVRYSPTQIGFFLIDYKGGGMANLFRHLPHLAGSISNLSGNIIHRAMVSIRSENERRQRIFLEAGVNSIGDYGRLYDSGRVKEPLPHILIIVDEFAELKRNEPDFMKELISVAQVGRSLGVHLILATQKPSGTVDDNIFSNSRFRICLRVQDKQDSMDMLHRPEAAFISNPGRAYLQVGNDELFESFQAAYTMEPYEDTKDKDPPVYLLDKYRRKHEIIPGRVEAGHEDYLTEKITHFSRILKMLCECNEASGLPRVSALWLPPLEDSIVLARETAVSGEHRRKPDSFRITVGRYDAPSMQKQGDYVLDLIETGHIIVCGSSLSGKSTFLQTFIYKHIENKSPDELNIYIVDYSNGALSCFRDSSLVGGYITGENEDRLKNLFCLLAEHIRKRRSGFDGVAYARRLECGDANEPAIMLVIDNYGAFREKTDLRYDRDMQEIIKSGESYGIYAVLTGASIGTADIPARLFENCRTGICLKLNDKYQYSECLRELRLPLLPDEGIAGRGLARIEGDILEFQTGLCCQGNDNERSKWIQLRMREINAAFPGSAAEEVPYVPDEPRVCDLDRYFKSVSGTGSILFGYDLGSGRPWYLPYDEVKIVLIAGRNQSGKTNACEVAAHYAEMSGMRVSTCGDISSLHDKLCGNPLYGEPDELVLCDDLADILAEFYENDFSREMEKDIADALRSREGARLFFTIDSARHSALAGRKIYEQIRSSCLGICLAGGLDKQNVFDFSYMSFTEQCAVKPQGTGTVLRKKNTAEAGDIIIPLT